MSKYLVTGGAGYIGGTCVEKMIDRGDEVVIVDNLSTGHEKNIHPKAIFVKGDVGDRDLMDKVFKDHKIEAVLHFAAFALVGESMTAPKKYFHNNFVQALNLLDSIVENKIEKFIFSSTCATYGIPDKMPMDETTSQRPINPYGESKLMLEKAVKWYHSAYGLKYTIFRYFNACGATKMILENHQPETHLIPIVFEAITGLRKEVSVFGTDYNTPDGTCVRDYVHVSDLIDAHLLAIKNMDRSSANEFNLGTGNGLSVKQIIDSVERVTDQKVPTVIGPRRSGDPDELVAKADKAMSELGWKPQFDSIDKIVDSVWEEIKKRKIQKND